MNEQYIFWNLFTQFEKKTVFQVNKARTDMVESRVQAAKELGYVIKFQIPCEKKEEEQIELSNYKLPLPIESYVKPPRPLVNTDLMEELSRDKPTGNSKEKIYLYL